jgi:hypothetical protein
VPWARASHGLEKVALSHETALAIYGITFRLKSEMQGWDLADTVRVELAVAYLTRGWQTVEVDLVSGETREVDLVEPAIVGLAEMGLSVTPHVRRLSIHEQMAE